jgi:hypothetical protein
MIIIFLLLLLLLILILWIVFIPVYLRINTDLNQYELSQAGTMKFSFHPGQTPAIRMSLFGFRIDMTKKQKSNEQLPVTKKKKSSFKRSPAAWIALQRGIIKSFRLKQFICRVDLDDVLMNAKLVPVLVLLNRGVVSVSTNFVDRNFLCLEIEGRINKMLWTSFLFFTKK